MKICTNYTNVECTKGVVINYGEGEATKREGEGGGQVKFYPYKKCVCGGGGGGVLAILKGRGGGHNKFWVLEV